MNEAEIFEKVKSIVIDKLNVDEAEVTMEASFIDDLGADSLDVMELVEEIEEAFDITVKEEDLDGFRTVGDAVNYIKEAKE